MNEKSGEFSNPISKPESFLNKLKNKFRPPTQPVSLQTVEPGTDFDTEFQKLESMLNPTPEKPPQHFFDELKNSEQQQAAEDQEKLRILREARLKQDEQTKLTQDILNNYFTKLGTDNPQKK